MEISYECSECGKVLDSSLELSDGTHLPCPFCGSTNRSIKAHQDEQFEISDHISMLGKRDGDSFTYRESQRLDGRFCSADSNENGSISFSTFGSSPQGEEETLKVCKLLVQKLNLIEYQWNEPYYLGSGFIDCSTNNIKDPELKLQFQVIRAITDKSYWEQLNIKGFVKQNNINPATIAIHIKDSILKKTDRIPPDIRKTIILVLDATLLPGISFEAVVKEFKECHMELACSLNFVAIWLVGPVLELTQRLDLLNSN